MEVMSGILTLVFSALDFSDKEIEGVCGLKHVFNFLGKPTGNIYIYSAYFSWIWHWRSLGKLGQVSTSVAKEGFINTIQLCK